MYLTVKHLSAIFGGRILRSSHMPRAVLLAVVSACVFGMSSIPSVALAQSPTLPIPTITTAQEGTGKTDATPSRVSSGHIVVIPTDMLILPGTAHLIEGAVRSAESSGAKLVIIELSTPGGMLTSTQAIVQTLLTSRVPVVVYVSPAGGTATSAGLFVTMAAHVAAMAPGTTIGAAHPVGGQGENVEGDMRAKIENATLSMVRSIANERGRNAEWAEKAVKESASATAAEAATLSVVDLVATSRAELLRQIAGRTIKTAAGTTVLEDYSALPVTVEELSLRGRVVNVLANPSVIALLWVGASAGLGVEIYNPGLILPGVVGLLCLLAALSVSEVIPITAMGVTFLVAGGLLLALEIIVPSGALAIGGIIAIALGALTLIDVAQAPDLFVAYSAIAPALLVLAGIVLTIGWKIAATRRQRPSVGFGALTGQSGEVVEARGRGCRVRVRGELWLASASEGEEFQVGDRVIVASHEGNVLIVKKGG